MTTRRKQNIRTLTLIISALIAVVCIVFFALFLFDRDVRQGVVTKAEKTLKPKLQPLLEDQIKDMVIKASDSLYRLSYTGFKISLDSGQATVTGFKLTPDPALLKRLIAAKRAPDNICRISVAKMELSNFGFTKTPQGRRFTVGRVDIHHSSVAVTNQLRPYNNQATEVSLLYKSFRALFNRMHISTIDIKNLDFQYVNNNASRQQTDHLKNLNIFIRGVRTSPSAEGKKARTAIWIDSFRMTTPDRYYDITAQQLALRPDKKQLTIAHAAVIPRYSKARFHQLAGFAKDRYHWKFDGIRYEGLDLTRFIRHQQLFVNHKIISKAWVEIYSNYNVPLKRESRRNAFPQEKFQTIAFDLTFKKISILNSDIFYRILGGKTDRVSTLAFRHSRTEIHNLTNNAGAIRADPYTRVHNRSRLMNAGSMETWYTFNLVNKTATVVVRSTLGTMDARAFNVLSAPLGLIEVKQGKIDKIELSLRLDEYEGKGHVDMYYSDLRLAFLKRQEAADTLKRRGFISFMTNIVLPNGNPGKNGTSRKGPVNVKRESWQSFFKFLLDASLDGMSSAMMGVYQKGKARDQNIFLHAADVIAGPGHTDQQRQKAEANQSDKNVKGNKNDKTAKRANKH
ncbi:hypothetical protein [Pedobacter sp. SYP-B3415]|uniref:hypothetical protein n=1 Tax=Pedobacter sp. SYP-B3415 TaxID=2496641 RepID=UPI00101BBD9D|nr:hypothetical protein [Pedobacter sp. SYP-B3415]